MEEYGLMDLITLATSVTIDRSIESTVTVIVAGLGSVLGALALLIVVFYAFGAITSKTKNSSNKKKEKKDAAIPPQKTVPAPKQMPFSPVAEQGISGEVVAAISAAVYAMEGNSNSVITSITPMRKRNPITGRNPWANAAVIENTRPF